MRRIAIALVTLVFLLPLLPVASAQTTQPWNWSNYTGTTRWDVTAIEDDSDCGGGGYTNRYSDVTIQFRGGSAVLGNMGHAAVGGTFVSPNILHVSSRTVADPPGSSDLSAYDVFFTADCTAFAARYTWDYSGPYQECSGSTRLNGVNRAGCPQPPAPLIPPPPPPSGQSVAAELSAARTDLNKVLELRELRDRQQEFVFAYSRNSAMAGMITLENQWIADETQKLSTLEPKTEGEYAAILAKDPDNFYANWDMAQLSKSQGKIDAYVQYINAALSNKNVAVSTRNEVRSNIAASMGEAELPTTQNSYLVRQVGIDGDAVQSVYGIDVAGQKADKDTEGINLFAFFTSGNTAVNTVTIH